MTSETVLDRVTGRSSASFTLSTTVVRGHNLDNQRTNGPVNAHLRSAAYTNKHV